MVYGRPAGFCRSKAAVKVNRDFCTGCMTCVKRCPQAKGRVLQPARDERGPYAKVVDAYACRGCGLCFMNCPTHAIAVTLMEPSDDGRLRWRAKANEET